MAKTHSHSKDQKRYAGNTEMASPRTRSHVLLMLPDTEQEHCYLTRHIAHGVSFVRITAKHWSTQSSEEGDRTTRRHVTDPFLETICAYTSERFAKLRRLRRCDKVDWLTWAWTICHSRDGEVRLVFYRRQILSHISVTRCSVTPHNIKWFRGRHLFVNAFILSRYSQSDCTQRVYRCGHHTGCRCSTT